MDHFGIGNAVRSLFRAYQQASRGSGRTTSLLNSVGHDDRIVVATAREADRLLRECQHRGLTTTVIVVSPKSPERLLYLRPVQGRTLFEHTWVEDFYQESIERAVRGIDELQTLASHNHAPPGILPRDFPIQG